MVRLKDEAKVTGSISVKLFQFHYGAIKSIAQPFVMKTHDRFNSTMVRLKAWIDSGNIRSKQFQFHYGAIKRFNYWIDQFEAL